MWHFIFLDTDRPSTSHRLNHRPLSDELTYFCFNFKHSKYTIKSWMRWLLCMNDENDVTYKKTKMIPKQKVLQENKNKTFP